MVNTSESDPLSLVLDEWTLETVQALIGRPESQRLEYKSATLTQKVPWDSMKEKVADAVACLASAEGGFLILGAGDGETFDAFGGTGLTDDDLSRLRRSVMDLVEPTPLIRGPVRFEDESGKDVVVIQVMPNPLWQPSRGPSGFRSRYEDQCLQIPIRELEQRLASNNLLRSSTWERAESLTAWAKGELNGTAGAPWLSVVAVPVLREDLYRTGQQLAKAAAGVEDAMRELAPGHEYRFTDAVQTSPGGLTPLPNSRRAISVDHDGVVIVTANPRQVEGAHSIYDIGELASWATALAVLIQDEIGVVGPVQFMVACGGIKKLIIPEPDFKDEVVPREHSLPGADTTLSFVADLTAEPDLFDQMIHLFLTRIRDGTGEPMGLAPHPASRELLEAVLAIRSA